MYLIIDNSEDGRIKFNFLLDKKIVQKNFQVRTAASITSCLDRALKSRRCRLHDLRGLGVVVGAGRFTATRLAVTAANTLAYALHIPVAAVKAGWTADSFLQAVKTAKPGIYALPQYSGAAHIGGKN